MYCLILVRHGQSQWNLENKFTGWYDADLTEKGLKEAEKCGELIKQLNIKFDTAFTSLQKRAIKTLHEINKKLGSTITQITKAWELNERHYGALQGLDKNETKKKYGETQVKIWRRSYDVPPPPMSRKDQNHPVFFDIYKNIDPKKIPDCESLKDTFNRAVPYFKSFIFPELKIKKKIIISAHGNSLRAICKDIFNISDLAIVKLEIPTGNPIKIIFGKDLKIENYEYLDKERAEKIFTNI